MTILSVANDFETTVTDNPLSDVATTINVASVTGAPSTYPYHLTIWDAGTYTDPGDDPAMEIVRVTNATDTSLTVTRGVEGTSGAQHASGSKVALLVTAGIFNDATYGINAALNAVSDHYVMEWSESGQVRTNIVKLGVLPLDETITLARIVIVGTLPVGQSIKADIRKNGTDVTNSIFVSDVPIEVLTTHTMTNDVYIAVGTLDSGQTTCSKDDVFYLVVTQVGTTSTGSDILAQLIF